MAGMKHPGVTLAMPLGSAWHDFTEDAQVTPRK